eukprot:COSAG01_NODE_522_length_15953_cov_207.754715_3_plen_59_part_00
MVVEYVDSGEVPGGGLGFPGVAAGLKQGVGIASKPHEGGGGRKKSPMWVRIVISGTKY